MLTHQRLQTCSPIKRLYCKLENSIQTYINYHKTHTMAMHYSGVGDTSMENLKIRTWIMIVPSGLAQAPAYFQELMTGILKDFPLP